MLKFRYFPLILLAIGPFLFLSCSREPAPKSQVEFLLGTTCSVTLYDKAPKDIFQKVFARVRSIEELMSVNIDTSEISLINRNAGKKAVAVSEETYTVISTALEFCRLSGGAFDIAIGRLVKLWGIGTDAARIPGPAEIAEALRTIDFTKVVLDPVSHTVHLEQEGMALDLGAIAKGWAADEAARILTEAKVKHAIVDFGGNVLVIGSHPSGRSWRIGVQNPETTRGTYLGIIAASDTAVVTSGVYERFFTGDDGTRYHHILDTGTGYPVQNRLTAVTVAAKNSMTADALSTTFFSLGLEKGLATANSLQDVGAVFVTGEKKLYITKNLEGIFEISNTDYSRAEP